MKTINLLFLTLILSISQAYAGPEGQGVPGFEVGNGGDWLLDRFYPSARAMAERLKELNPDGIDPQAMLQLINDIEIEISDKPLKLRGEPKDAINFFPQKKKLLLYRARWEYFFIEKMVVTDLIYHELVPFFKGNDPKYLLARAEEYREELPVTLKTLKAADYFAEMNSSAGCGLRVTPDAMALTVTAQWIDDPSFDGQCLMGKTPVIYQCSSENPVACVAARQEKSELQISLLPDSRLQMGWVWPGHEQADQIYYFIKGERGTSQRKLFSALEWSKAPGLTYGENCAESRQRARESATRQCFEAMKSANGGKFNKGDAKSTYFKACKFISLKPLQVGAGTGESGCAILYTVEAR